MKFPVHPPFPITVRHNDGRAIDPMTFAVVVPRPGTICFLDRRLVARSMQPSRSVVPANCPVGCELLYNWNSHPKGVWDPATLGRSASEAVD